MVIRRYFTIFYLVARANCDRICSEIHIASRCSVIEGFGSVYAYNEHAKDMQVALLKMSAAIHVFA